MNGMAKLSRGESLMLLIITSSKKDGLANKRLFGRVSKFVQNPTF